MLFDWRSLVSLCVVLIVSFGIADGGSASKDGGSSADTNRVAQRQGQPSNCPPDSSAIVLFTRHGFEGGHRGPIREYGELLGEWEEIIQSRIHENDIVRDSIAAATRFVDKMAASGHDMDVADVIIHSETDLNLLVRMDNAVDSAHYARQLAVIREMKRVICSR